MNEIMESNQVFHYTCCNTSKRIKLAGPTTASWHPSNLANYPISGRVDRASATEAVDSGSIPDWVKPKTIKIGIHSFPA